MEKTIPLPLSNLIIGQTGDLFAIDSKGAPIALFRDEASGKWDTAWTTLPLAVKSDTAQSTKPAPVVTIEPFYVLGEISREGFTGIGVPIGGKANALKTKGNEGEVLIYVNEFGHLNVIAEWVRGEGWVQD